MPAMLGASQWSLSGGEARRGCIGGRWVSAGVAGYVAAV